MNEKMTDDVMECCPSCTSKLKEPYVNCVHCQPNVQICLRCFAKGVEFDTHSNDHSYEIKKLSFSLFDDDKWTARDELQLLDQLDDHGFGNWPDISKKFNKKSAKDTEEHFMKHYINDSKSPLPKVTMETEQTWRRPMDYQESAAPPRPGVDSNADDELFLIGYMPARGDFIVEPDNFAESDLKDVEYNYPLVDEQNELMTEMNHHIVDMYYIRQQERNFKKKFNLEIFLSMMKNYGLLDAPMTNIFYNYGREERMVRDIVKKFAQLMKPEAYEKLIQGILYQKVLESKIQSLQEYRRSGLRVFRDAAFYEKQKRRRLRTQKMKTYKLDEIMLHNENPVSCQIWLQRQLNKKKNVIAQIPISANRKAPPLDITGLPGAELLTDDEKKLCSNVRISPKDYMAFRNTLQEESFRSNGVKLQTARSLLKMDVNKTKKLYDFLLNTGQIKNLITC